MRVILSLKRFDFANQTSGKGKQWRRRPWHLPCLRLPFGAVHLDRSAAAGLSCVTTALPFLYISFLTWEEKLIPTFHF